MENPDSTSQGLISEGLASIGGGLINAQNVFYNPVQVFNRDLSIVALKAFADLFEEEIREKCSAIQAKQPQTATITSTRTYKSSKLRILEPLAASGLRSVRYALELKDVIEFVVAGDIDTTAVKTIVANRALNGLSCDRMKVVLCEANQLMYSTIYGGLDAALAYSVESRAEEDSGRGPVQITLNSVEKAGFSKFNVIDLDPYGSVANFLDAALQAIDEGGLLCITSTDMPVLCGNYPEVSYYKYGGTALRARYKHEMAIRLLLHSIGVRAARYKRIIQPILSCSIDFYVRCFVRVYSSAMNCKLLASNTALVLQCKSCEWFKVIPMGLTYKSKSILRFKPPSLPSYDFTKCTECDKKGILIGGPIYCGQLHSMDFVNRCLQLVSDENSHFRYKGLSMVPRLRGLLAAISEELSFPLYYHLSYLINCIKTEAMKLINFKSALLHLGYEVSHFHREPQSIKTNAPSEVVFDIIRKWAESHPPKDREGNPILRKPYTIDPKTIQLETLHPSATSKYGNMPKWFPNPMPNWGPNSRAKPSMASHLIRPQKKRKVSNVDKEAK